MNRTISDFLIQCLYDWTIRRIYGFPGDGIMGALNLAREKVRFIQARHEELAAFLQALVAHRPVIINAHCDPDVPPLPPHINFELAKGYMSTLFQGDPNEMGILNQSAKQMMSADLSRLRG